MSSSHTQNVTQRTIKHSISYVGTGLHTGKKVIMTIKPAKVNSGIVFIRKDILSIRYRHAGIMLWIRHCLLFYRTMII